MKSDVRITIIPTYKCNQNCKYCIYNNYKSVTSVLPLDWIDNALNQISREFNIVQVNISGGEPSLLSELYFEMLYFIIKQYCKKIILETNFITFNKAIINRCDVINVGYNFNNYSPLTARIFENIKAAVDTGKVINIKTLDISCERDPIYIINKLNSLKIKSWEIVPYHSFIGSDISFKDYTFFENVVKKYINLSKNMKFAFQNLLQLENILRIDNFNIKTIYLTPNCKFSLQNFDKNQFSFKEFDDFNTFFKEFIILEKKCENFCEKCTSKIHCMANYFINLSYIGKSCYGFKDLINDFNKKV